MGKLGRVGIRVSASVWFGWEGKEEERRREASIKGSGGRKAEECDLFLSCERGHEAILSFLTKT